MGGLFAIDNDASKAGLAVELFAILVPLDMVVQVALVGDDIGAAAVERAHQVLGCVVGHHVLSQVLRSQIRLLTNVTLVISDLLMRLFVSPELGSCFESPARESVKILA